MQTVTHEPAETRRRLLARLVALPRRRQLAGALTGLVALSLLTLGMNTLLRGILTLASQMLLYLIAVVVVGLVGGLLPAVAAALAATALIAYYFIEPFDAFAIASPDNVVALLSFLVAAAISSVVGPATHRRQEAETLAAAIAESRERLRVLASEQAALRRVATLVARGVPPAEIFPAVAEEVRTVFAADATPIARLDADGFATVVAVVGDPPAALAVGSRWKPEPPLAIVRVLSTCRSARTDDYGQGSGPSGEAVRRMGIRSGVAAPIVVDGRLWGVVAIVSRRGPFPADTEQRLAGFTELLGTAIANAEGRAQLEESRDGLRRLAEEQAALRRVATLVARGVAPAEGLAAVAQEVGSILGADATGIARLEPDGSATVVARVGDLPEVLSLGSRWTPDQALPLGVTLRTGRPARRDDYTDGFGPADEAVRALGIRSVVAAPIIVEGRLWGTIGILGRHERFPDDTEQRMAGFTELIGTAVANADSRAQLTASRARIVAAADEARRRIERDLHDGTQQRLVSLCLELRLARSDVPGTLPALQVEIGRLADDLSEAIEELREIARGIHPAILSEGGLAPALRTLARRAALPVELEITTDDRVEEPIEVAAYYVVSEALTNTTKHAHASRVRVAVEKRDDRLHLSIVDDGVGGADPGAGSGLIGLSDRVHALDGSMEVDSRRGRGTTIVAELPLRSAATAS
jgi:signal transduction histidine kinase